MEDPSNLSYLSTRRQNNQSKRDLQPIISNQRMQNFNSIHNSSSSDEDIKKQQERASCEYNEFWSKRQKECRILLVIQHMGNLYYQLAGIFDPVTDMHRVMNILYTVNSAFCLGALFYVYRAKSNINILYPVVIATFLRLCVRIVDFEMSKDLLNERSPKLWEWTVFTNSMSCLTLVQTIYLCFDNWKGNRLLSYILLIMFIFVYQYAIINDHQIKITQIHMSLGLFIIIGVYQNFMYRITMSHKEQSDQKILAQSKFQHIFDNSEESIIILSKNTAEYANKMFLKTFESLIKNHKPNLNKQEHKEGLETQSQISFDVKGKLINIIKLFKKEDEELSDIREQHQREKDIVYIKYFKLHQKENKMKDEYNILDIINMNHDLLSEQVFQIIEDEHPDNIVEKFVKIKITTYKMLGDAKSYMLQIQDVSKSILLEHEREHNELLTLINATVSHELRNPLNSLIAQNIEKKNLYEKLEKILQTNKIENEFKTQFFQIIRKLKDGNKIQQSSASIMEFLVQDLLDYAQMKVGKFRKNITEFNIRDTIEQIMVLQKYKAEQLGIKFYTTFLKPVDLSIKSDEKRIQQVLLNLISNALKFTKQGEVQTIVETYQERQEKFLKISVRDTGIGIKEKDQNKLFKLFGYISDSNQMNTHGIGLGLVISEQITSKFGGKISLESEFGVGSTFTFTIKLDQEGEDAKIEEEELQQYQCNTDKLYFKWAPEKLNMLGTQISYVMNLDKGQSFDNADLCKRAQDLVMLHKQKNAIGISHNSIQLTSLNLSEKPKILIVDDQMFNINALKIIMQYKCGLDPDDICDHALCGEDAIQKVVDDVKKNGQLHSSYKLILMDCNMPFMDGYEATHRIRQYLYEKRIKQPIITAITGHTEQSYINKSIECGMNQITSKPIDYKILQNLTNTLGF